jgi:Domain of unknown function (DUF4112)
MKSRGPQLAARSSGRPGVTGRATRRAPRDASHDTISRVRPPQPTRLDELRRWAILLDSAFKVPGTSIRFGLDAIIGLVPGLGDLLAPVYTLILLGTALKMRVPAVVAARMVLNAGIDMLLGLVPFAGDIADVFWKADLRNIALLERHARPGVPPTRGDYWFVLGCIGVVVAIALVPIVFLIWLLTRFSLV